MTAEKALLHQSSDSRTEMRAENIEAFLRENAPRLRRLSDRKDVSLGFNAFALVSDTYYRENFHSDVIRAILDPHSGHGEGPLFLKKFVEFISAEANSTANSTGKPDLGTALSDLAVDDSAEVVREEGRVDVKIKAPNWTIIVENKINGAGDMDRQIPRYVENCRKQGENVVAVVYITAALKGSPSDVGWKNGDKEMVEPLLVPVIGYSETQSVRNLAENWIGPCALAARGFHAKSILEQYAELLRHQSGETMNQDEIKNVMSSMAANGIQYSELLRVLNEMPRTLANMIRDEFRKPTRKKEGDYSAVKIYSGTTAYFELAPIEVQSADNTCQNVVIHIDIRCNDTSDRMISFFAYLHDEWNTRFLELLKEYDGAFYQPSVQDRLYLPFDRNDAFCERAKLFDKVSELLRFLKNNRSRLETICREAYEEEEKSNANG